METKFYTIQIAIVMSSVLGLSEAGKLIKPFHFYWQFLWCSRVNLVKSFSCQIACYIPKRLDNVLLKIE